MFSAPAKFLVFVAVAAWVAPPVWSRDTLTIDLPRRSRLSPVQRLNREGVEEVNKHDYEKAERIFLKAYLYDPTDPFTLNNLGYIAELEGQLDRAQRFYKLAAEQGCTADIDLSSAKSLIGKPMTAALDNIDDLPMRVNRMNVEAMRLLSQDHGFQAIALLEQARALDPNNPFTLNNLGVANETVGDEWSALKFYRAAADTHSSEPVVVTEDHSWRGRPVSEMAAASAKRMEDQMQQLNSNSARAYMLSLRGVHAENENDGAAAKRDFLEAYSLDPNDAFSINNRGYVAEEDGDLESAKFFYEKARRADDAGTKVGLASDGAAEGKTLFTVASGSNQKVDGALAKYSWSRHRLTGPIELTPRGGESTAPQSPATPHKDEESPASATPAPQSPR